MFLKDCPSGELDRLTFVKIYQAIFPFGDPEDYANYIFRVYDGNHNGLIDFSEFICAMSVTSHGTLEEKLECRTRSCTAIDLADLALPHPGAFQLYGIEGSGAISYQGLLKIIQSIYKMTGSMVMLPPDEDTPEYV